MLGLSTQVPAVWQYVSDGPYKTYAADGIHLQFKHTDRKNEIVGISEETALVIQALRALGILFRIEAGMCVRFPQK